RPAALHELAEARVLLVADRLVEARGRACSRLDLVGLMDRERGLVRDLLERGLAAELRPERALRAVHLLEPFDDVHGHADRARLVRERPRHRLADPPGGVGRELVAPP